MIHSFNFEEDSFPNAWVRGCRLIANSGFEFQTEFGNRAKSIALTIELSKKAVDEIYAKKMHPKFPTRERHLEEYIKEFDLSFQERFKEFSYTYLDRFSCQLKPMEEKIRSIGSRRCLMISWQPAIDLRSDSPPCCQIVQLFNLNGKEVEGFVIFRSNDFYNAWQSNLIGLVYMIDKYILSPNKLKLTHLIYFSTIAHIYAEFLEEAKKLELIPNFRGV